MSAVPSPKTRAVRFDRARGEQSPLSEQPVARRRRKSTQPTATAAVPAPSKSERCAAMNSKPVKTAPVAPRLARMSGRAQQDDATTAASPATLPRPASHLPEGGGSVAEGAGSCAAVIGVSVMIEQSALCSASEIK